MNTTNAIVLANSNSPSVIYVGQTQSPAARIKQFLPTLQERADFWTSGVIYSSPSEGFDFDIASIGVGAVNYNTLHAFFPGSYWSPASWSQACNFLGQVVDGLKRRLDYQGVYQAYLLRQMSEDEFQAAAREYAYESREIAPDVIRSGVAVLQTHTTAQFSVSELAEMFGTDEIHIEKALGARLASP